MERNNESKKITLQGDNILEYIFDSSNLNDLSYKELYSLTNLLITDYNNLNIEFNEKRNHLESLKYDNLVMEIQQILILGNTTIEKNKQELNTRLSNGILN